MKKIGVSETQRERFKGVLFVRHSPYKVLDNTLNNIPFRSVFNDTNINKLPIRLNN